MQIRTIRKGFEAFQVILSILIQILTIRMEFEAF